MDLDAALNKVRKLIERSSYHQDHGEQDRANDLLTQADALMFKYSIDKAMAEAAKPSAEQAKPKRIKVEMCGPGDPLAFEISCLVNVVARHCRCMAIWLPSDYRPHVSEIFGYESDVRYAEMLYTQLLMHMTSVLFPKMDPSKTLGENCYTLHNQGLNWLDMAELDGWKKLPAADYPGVKVPFTKDFDFSVSPSTKVGGIYKRAYYAECKRLGEQPKIVPASASRQARTDAFRKSVAKGYVNRIAERLFRVEKAQNKVGTALVLAGQKDTIEAMFAEAYPHSKSSVDEFKAKSNPEAMLRGMRRADEADLSVGVGGGRARAIG
jgi:hypothetical protein